jgi:hypothetical protein
MHSVLVTVDIQPDRIKEAEEGLDAFIIPMCRQSPGFTHGIWWNSLDGEVGYGLITFDTEPNARAMAEQHVDAPGDAPVTIRSVEVGKVYAEA